MSDDEQDMATCGACQAEVPANSIACPTCGVSFSGIVEENLGECGACGALVPLDSKTCSQCGVLFVHDDVVQVLSDWMDDTGLDVPTLFGRLDTDNSGSIDTDELREGLISLQIAALPPVEVERLIAEIDQDQNGTIEIGELQNILGQGSMSFSDNVLDSVMKKSGINDREAFVAFATSFDENENKYLDRAELKKAADAFLEREEVEVKPMERDVPEEEAEEEEAEEEEAEEEEAEEEEAEEEDSDEEDAFASALASMSEEEEEEEEDDDEEDVEFDPSSLIGDEDESDDTSPEEILRSLGEAIAEKGMTIRQVFESIDADLDGRINGPELQNGISEILGDDLDSTTVFDVLGVLDSDDDGSIDPMELIEAIEALELEIASDEMSDLIDSIDDDDDDLEPLDEESANGIMLKIGTELNETGKKIDDLFDGFDIDSSGELDHYEFSMGLKSLELADLPPHEIDRIVKFLDSDDNGRIDLNELRSNFNEWNVPISDLKPKRFEPEGWQKFLMKQYENFFPVMYVMFGLVVAALLVNGLVGPVDGSTGNIVFDADEGAFSIDNNRFIEPGEVYPCDKSIQVSKCANSLTPLSGENGSSSMPKGFHWDGILGIVLMLAGMGGIAYLQVLTKGWREIVRAERKSDQDDSEEEAEEEDVDEEEAEEEESEEEQAEEEEAEEEDVEEEDVEEAEEDEEVGVDVGDRVGVELEEGEEAFGEILEFVEEDGDEFVVVLLDDGDEVEVEFDMIFPEE